MRIERDDQLRQAAAIASVAVAFTLILAKLAVWVASGSVALLSSLIDSTLDAFASIMTLLAVRHAARPADRSHRFGHGKAEALSALAQAAFVLASGLILTWQALRRIIHPETVMADAASLAVMAGSILLTGALLLFQRWVVKRTNSVAIAADRLHYTGDLMMNLSVIAALLLTQYFSEPLIDPLFALGVALLWFVQSWRIGRDAVDLLMDRELPKALRDEIETVIRGVEGVRGVHDLRTRSTGTQVAIIAHIELDGEINLHRAHSITDRIEAALEEGWPGADVTLHQEPVGLADERLDNRIAAGRSGG